ncbi:DUF2269 family protein [Calidifontibacillus erzurumensis]|uniref:DUF2269 family protein n=1 Tax=Calidifontibacillus erzurumensis TaxID=2741433 RepID=A0A8J8GFQ9_9BACI|nr:DUF2269 family protein [Calidifontibacillus erzurumensis]NSL52817.1 DUF2269 family protein [Calidifontibacillus erzurumensis]
MDYQLYRIILYLHVSSVILTIGPFFILFPFIKKLREANEELTKAYLDLIKFAVQVSKHAGHVLFVTGILLVWITSWTWTTSWIVMTLVVMLCSGYFIARAFSPTVRKFNDPNQDRDAAVRKLYRSTWAYVILLMLILWFMVAKPTFW